MSTTALPPKVESMSESEYISWEDFQDQYLVREDGYKYEWLNGKVEKTPRSMDKRQLIILRNLLIAFKHLENEGKVSGYLVQEADLLFLNHHRRPDICWLTDKQIVSMAQDTDEIPAFVIEVISSNDMINRVVAKMEDYRAAGVQVVWKILPLHQQVHVYTGKNLDVMKVYSGDMTFSAAPVLPDFSISVDELFKKELAKDTE